MEFGQTSSSSGVRSGFASARGMLTGIVASEALKASGRTLYNSLALSPMVSSASPRPSVGAGVALVAA